MPLRCLQDVASLANEATMRTGSVPAEPPLRHRFISNTRRFVSLAAALPQRVRAETVHAAGRYQADEPNQPYQSLRHPAIS